MRRINSPRVINTEMFSDSAIYRKSSDFRKGAIYRFGPKTDLPNKISEDCLKMNQKRLSQQINVYESQLGVMEKLTRLEGRSSGRSVLPQLGHV